MFTAKTETLKHKKMSKHTLEKWKQHPLYTQIIIDDSNDFVRVMAYDDYAPKVVERWNACAGMENPAEEIANLRADRQKLIEALEEAIPYLERSIEKHGRETATDYHKLLSELK